MVDTVNNTPGTSSTDSAKLSAEEVIAQLRTMQSKIEDVAPLSKEQRKLVQRRLRDQPKNIVDAAINVIGVLDLTGSWTMPFYGSLGLLLLGAGLSFFMRPDRPFMEIARPSG